MRLTKKLRDQVAKELWAWCAETGKLKHEWPGWKMYGEMVGDCPFCEYDNRHNKLRGCPTCPLKIKFGSCSSTSYKAWLTATTAKDRKHYASLFLKQLKELK